MPRRIDAWTEERFTLSGLPAPMSKLASAGRVGQDPSEALVRRCALQDRVRQGDQATRRVTRTERWRVARWCERTASNSVAISQPAAAGDHSGIDTATPPPTRCQ